MTKANLIGVTVVLGLTAAMSAAAAHEQFLDVCGALAHVCFGPIADIPVTLFVF
jgi:hypothetical protein